MPKKIIYAEDAINALTKIEKQYAVGDVRDKLLEWAKLAITVLPSAQPQTDCEYCHEDSDGFVRPIEKNSHAFVRFGMNGWEISLRAKGWNGSAKIMYCPMCGRRLAHGRHYKQTGGD